MFEYESCYTGYMIEYNNDIYYVYDDDEKYLYMHKIVKKDNSYLQYKVDLTGAIKIDKHHSNYRVRSSFLYHYVDNEQEKMIYNNKVK